MTDTASREAPNPFEEDEGFAPVVQRRRKLRIAPPTEATTNPLLDDDEDEGPEAASSSMPALAEEAANPLLEEDGDEEEEAYDGAPVAVVTPKPAAKAPAKPKKSIPASASSSSAKRSNSAEEKPTHNPMDERLGNLAGTPKPTSWKKKTDKKYRRRDITEKDLLVLAFLAKFKMGNASQLSILLKVSKSTAHRRLLGLREAGLVGSHQTLGAYLLWYVKGKGLRVLDQYDELETASLKAMSEEDLETTQVGHYLAVGQVAAQLAAGWNPLGKRVEGGAVELGDLVPEYAVTKAWWSWAESFGVPREKMVQAARRARAALLSERSGAEALAAQPQFLTVTPARTSKHELSLYHHPDLVVRGAGEDFSGHIAVEVKTSVKSVADYERILRTYRSDNIFGSSRDAVAEGATEEEQRRLAGLYARPIYSQVIWVTQHTKAAERIMAAAERVGLPDGYFDVAPLYAADGSRFAGKAWRL